MIDYVRIGKQIRLLRTKAELTQEQLATKAEVAIGTLQALERRGQENHKPRQPKKGRRKPEATRVRPPRDTTPESIEKIAKVLKTTLQDLMADPDTVRTGDPRLVGLDDEALSVAHAYAKANTAVRLHIRDVLLKKIPIPNKFASLEDQIEAAIDAAEREDNGEDNPPDEPSEENHNDGPKKRLPKS